MEPKNIAGSPSSQAVPAIAEVWATEWQRWQEIPQLLQASGLSCRETDPDVLVIAPKSHQNATTRYRLVVTGVIHGVEVAGLAVLNELARYVALQPNVINAPIVLAIGNRAAALNGTRFVERDLNRSFARQANDLAEDKRAKVLEKYLKSAEYYLDLHQTNEPAANPFFIFPYEKKSVQFAADLDARIPIITHWGKPFSAEGCCSDEYVQKNGGIGITLELGQNGFHPFHVGAGVLVAWRAVMLACQQKKMAPETAPRYFTWSEVKAYPEGDVRLHEGHYNFKEVKQGDELGRVNGQPILASASGLLLFPKYVRDLNPNLPRPLELYRIIKPIRAEELGVS